MKRMMTKRMTMERMMMVVVDRVYLVDGGGRQGMMEGVELKGVVEQADGYYWVLKRGSSRYC